MGHPRDHGWRDVVWHTKQRTLPAGKRKDRALYAGRRTRFQQHLLDHGGPPPALDQQPGWRFADRPARIRAGPRLCETTSFAAVLQPFGWWRYCAALRRHTALGGDDGG